MVRILLVGVEVHTLEDVRDVVLHGRCHRPVLLSEACVVRQILVELLLLLVHLLLLLV